VPKTVAEPESPGTTYLTQAADSVSAVRRLTAFEEFGGGWRARRLPATS